MVEPDARDDGAFWFVNNIGRVQLASNAALHDRILAALSSEFKQRYHGDHFKEAQVNLLVLNCTQDRLKMFYHMLLAYKHTVYLHAFSESVDVW